MKLSRAAMISAALLAIQASAPALAGPYADDMAKCLVKSTSPTDRSDLVKWLFASAVMHPEIRPIASVSQEQRDGLNRTTARLFERLLTESCRAETQNAIKYEGPATFEASFNVLGQVAGRELFSDPSVAQSISGLMHYVDKSKLEAILVSALRK
jgi:hypothetical protein